MTLSEYSSSKSGFESLFETPFKIDFRMFESHMLSKTIMHITLAPNDVDEDGRTCLHHAALYESEEGLVGMLQSNIDPNIVDCMGQTALHYLLSHQTMNPYKLYRLVRHLLVGGADPNVGNPGDLTPLMMAVLTSDVSLVQLMCDYGADINARFLTSSSLLFSNNMTALSLAVSKNETEIVQCLKSYEPSPETVFHALQKASPVMKYILLGAQ